MWKWLIGYGDKRWCWIMERESSQYLTAGLDNRRITGEIVFRNNQDTMKLMIIGSNICIVLHCINISDGIAQTNVLHRQWQGNADSPMINKWLIWNIFINVYFAGYCVTTTKKHSHMCG